MRTNGNSFFIYLDTEQLSTSFQIIVANLFDDLSVGVNNHSSGLIEISIHGMNYQKLRKIRYQWKRHLEYVGGLEAINDVSKMYDRIVYEQNKHREILNELIKPAA